MAGTGGYQRPTTPAAVSGVGAGSQRTDGNPSAGDPVQAAKYLSGLPYGQNKVLNNQEQAVPLAGSVQPSDVSAPSVGGGQSFGQPSSGFNVQSLDQPGDPSIPLTHGMPFGPGDDSIPGHIHNPLAMNQETGDIAQSHIVQGQYQSALASFQKFASNPMASPGLAYLAERLKNGY